MVVALLAHARSCQGLGEPAKVWSRLSSGLDPQTRVSEHLGDLGALRAPIEARILEFAPQWRVELGLTPFEVARLETELVRHGDGAHFARHIDTARVARRVMSVVYYFHAEPKAFDGGLLRLFAFDGTSVDIEPQCDLVAVFPSFVVHEVTAVSCPSERFMDSRFAINCWLWDRQRDDRTD